MPDALHHRRAPPARRRGPAGRRCRRIIRTDRTKGKPIAWWFYEGKPYSVKYHELPALLLNEVQEQEREIAALKAQMAQLQRQLAESGSAR